MEADPPLPPLRHLWIVGAGRMGLALGLLLHRAGGVALTYSGRRAAEPDHPLFHDPPCGARYLGDLSVPDGPLDALVLAVPDAALGELAARLAALPLPRGLPVLHTSGSLGADVLAPLAAIGCETGSLHPLAAVADPVGGMERLRGAWYANEGSPRAMAMGERIVALAEGRTLPITTAGKPLYHAAAVFASNYVVALLAVAERLMESAGVPPAWGRAALAELAAGAVANVADAGPATALTGPVARGDAGTVERHLAQLSPTDRALYSVLARETLALARQRGLADPLAARIEHLLEGEA